MSVRITETNDQNNWYNCWRSTGGHSLRTFRSGGCPRNQFQMHRHSNSSTNEQRTSDTLRGHSRTMHAEGCYRQSPPTGERRKGDSPSRKRRRTDGRSAMSPGLHSPLPGPSTRRQQRTYNQPSNNHNQPNMTTNYNSMRRPFGDIHGNGHGGYPTFPYNHHTPPVQVSPLPGSHRQGIGPGFFSYCHQPAQPQAGGPPAGAPCLLPCQHIPNSLTGGFFFPPYGGQQLFQPQTFPPPPTHHHFPPAGPNLGPMLGSNNAYFNNLVQQNGSPLFLPVETRQGLEQQRRSPRQPHANNIGQWSHRGAPPNPVPPPPMPHSFLPPLSATAYPGFLLHFLAMFSHPHHHLYHHSPFPLLGTQQQPSTSSNNANEAFENENYEALLSLAERLGKNNLDQSIETTKFTCASHVAN